jgi:hypothetical protein
VACKPLQAIVRHSKCGVREQWASPLREAMRMDSREIRLEHVVLGLLRADGAATRLVSRLGVEPDDVRQAVVDLRPAALPDRQGSVSRRPP